VAPPTVLAVHGLTLNAVEFRALTHQLGDDATVLAPDLRGRGTRRGDGPPYGLATHADDLAALLRDHGGDPAVVVGHSWGAAVALVLAHRFPALVRSVVLVDGGLPASPAPGAHVNPTDRVLARLATTFPSVDAYLDTWRSHPGLVAHWNDHIEALFTADLVGEPPELRPGLRAEAFLEDTASYVETDLSARALAEVTCPIVLVRAGRGMLDDPVPLYGNEHVPPGVRDVFLPELNHYTVLFTDAGAAAVADVVRDELEGVVR
jgi:lipase